MSRKSVERGQITLHPGGIPHGPHPGTVEKSIGKESTDEMAVMIDPFHPLMITEEELKIEDPDYYKSWQEMVEGKEATSSKKTNPKKKTKKKTTNDKQTEYTNITNS